MYIMINLVLHTEMEMILIKSRPQKKTLRLLL